jgi:hypothetical protein
MRLPFSSMWPRRSDGLPGLGIQRTAQGHAGAGQSRHHGSHGYANDLSQLSIRQTLEFAEYEQLMEVIRQAAERPRNQHGVIALKQQRFRIRLWSGATVLLFIERVGRWLVAMTTPAIARVANDSEEPRPPISAHKCPEVSKGPQGGLLHHIFRIAFVPHQPARQAVAGIQVRNDDSFKALSTLECNRRSIQTTTHDQSQTWWPACRLPCGQCAV